MDFLKEDLKRYMRKNIGILKKMKIIIMNQGIWATIIYRAGSWCVGKKNGFRIISFFLTVVQKITEILTGISIPFIAVIGKGLYIGHFGGIVLHLDSVLGEYCNLSQGVTIGQAGRGGLQKIPKIGNRVFIGPGAKIFGGIHIGDDVAIGANAVVNKNLPDMAVAVGVPAKSVSYKGSMDFIIIRSS